MNSRFSTRHKAARSLLAMLVAPGFFAVLLTATVTGAGGQPGEPWSAPARAAKKQNPFPADAASLATGKRLYVQHCLSCHGASGRGDGPAAKDLEKSPGNFADPMLWNHTDGELFWKITEGKKPMPTFGKLMSDEERWHVVNYIRTLTTKKASTQDRQKRGNQ